MVFTIYKNLQITPTDEDPKVWKQFAVSFLGKLL